MTDLKDLARRVSELQGPSRDVDAETRFWAKVTRGRATGCWLWNGAKHGTRQQRGTFWANGKKHDAARWVFQNVHGRQIANGNVVMHTCDNPLCVNPLHLREGTQAENVRDMLDKGRGRPDRLLEGSAIGRQRLADNPSLRARGSRHGKAKLSDGDVALIRESTELTSALVARYNVNPTTIQRIRSGKRRLALTAAALIARSEA